MMFENFGTVVYCFQISFKTNLDELGLANFYIENSSQQKNVEEQLTRQ